MQSIIWKCTGGEVILEQLRTNLFGKGGEPHLWRVNGLMLVNAVLMGIVVGVGAYAPRYRRHPLIGLLYLGATILLLPIVSLVATTVGNQHISSTFSSGTHFIVARCSALHIILALIWTGLVLVIGTNTSTIVAGDSRESKNIDPPTELLIKAIWTSYLALSTIRTLSYESFFEPPLQLGLILAQAFVIIFTKLLFKYSIFYKAQRSFAFGRSPRLIAGYMAELQQVGRSQWTAAADQQVCHPPPLVVMGEDTAKVDKQPHGYNFKMVSSKRLVTLDKVWQLDDMGHLPAGARPKDVCFSFALFKLLRCRFAKYTIFEAGFMKVQNFFLDTLVQADDGQRLFEVIADELSFIHDYYYSSLPISYTHRVLPILSITLSVYSIMYCLYLAVWLTRILMNELGTSLQIVCRVHCLNQVSYKNEGQVFVGFGNAYFDAIPLYLVVAALVLAEIKDIVFYMCSNWTKVALICDYTNNTSWQQSPTVQKRISFVFNNFRSRLVNSWEDKMSLCSILRVHQLEISLLHLRRLLRLPNRHKKVKVPSVVKEAIFKALKKVLTSEQERLVPEHIRRPRPPISGSTAGAGGGHLSSDSQRIGYTILVWHIATSILEMKQPQPSSSSDSEGQLKIAATHLSCYCAYLVACCPELLPDDDEWCKQLYKDVKKGAARILRAAPKAQCEQLVEMLSADSNHDILKDGARLAKKLVDSNLEWEMLAQFWSEMVLYVAPSENLEGHAVAIARGGELITLLWTALSHAGVVGRA